MSDMCCMCFQYIYWASLQSNLYNIDSECVIENINYLNKGNIDLWSRISLNFSFYKKISRHSLYHVFKYRGGKHI